MRNRFWLVTTAHLKDRIWFKDEEDFKAGMNFVAILAAAMPVAVLAFILMSNHVHLVLECTPQMAEKFITRFKKFYSQYHTHKYGARQLLLNNDIDIRPLSVGDESLERAIAYTLMNCVAANICLHPSGYPWGTGGVYFNAAPCRCRTVGHLSGRALTKLLHSRSSIPKEYKVDERGYIRPESYVKTRFVESLFKTPKRLNYFLNSSSKAKHLVEAPSFNDQLIHGAIKDLCVSLFRCSHLPDLNEQQTAELLKQLRYRFSADPNQLSRVSGIPYEMVCKLLETF